MERKLETLHNESVTPRGCLYVALELSERNWKVGCSDGARLSEHTVATGDTDGLLAVIERAKRRLGLGSQAQVRSCYEAGRDGFWLHRWLVGKGIENVVVDSASIEVNRRARRAKSDGLDVRKLVAMLMRWAAGERRVWSVLRVPSEAQEAARRGHRERERLKKERTAHVNRMKSLLVLHNIRLQQVGGADWGQRVRALGLAPQYCEELEREGERLELLQKQLTQVNREGREQADEQQRQLCSLLAVGQISAWVLVRELFGWRRFANRRELGACAGLAPTPYASGDTQLEQGISKAGNRRVRALMVELAWIWLRHQPGSALTIWFQKRFAGAGGRARRIGIVALARRLLVALWRFLEHGVIPQGAQLKAG